MEIKANGDAYANRNPKKWNKFAKKNAKSFGIFWSQHDIMYQVVGEWLYEHIAPVDSHIPY